MFTKTENREIILSRLVFAEGNVTSKDIQKVCMLSRKTLAKEMQEVDEFLQVHGARVCSLKGKGYEIRIFDEEKYKDFYSDFLIQNGRDKYLYLDKNNLIYCILFEIVLRDGYISIDELAEKFHYSRSVIAKSMEAVKKNLAKYRCTLEAKPRYGVRLNAGEWRRRICIIFLEKIAHHMSKSRAEISDYMNQFIDKEAYNYTGLMIWAEQYFSDHHIKIQMINQTKVLLYIILSQMRLDFYDQMEFDAEETAHIKETRFFSMAKQFAAGLEKQFQFVMAEKDVMGTAIFLDCYVTREHSYELESGELENFVQDIDDFIRQLMDLYPGVERGFDGMFTEECICFFSGMKERLFWQIPMDEESAFAVKQDGNFILDLCLDFAGLYYEKYNVKLPDTELVYFYYIISSSFLRNRRQKAPYRAVFVSRHGIHVAANASERFLLAYGKWISEGKAVEFSEVWEDNLREYDFLVTDIEQKRIGFTSLPIIYLDSFRELHSWEMRKYLVLALKKELEILLRRENIIRDILLKTKEEVFEYLADHYILQGMQQEFIDNCRLRNSFVSNERNNRIALISTPEKYYPDNKWVILFNRVPFLWDNEQVQMIILFKRRNRNMKDTQMMNVALAGLLNGKADVVQSISAMGTEELIDYIAGQACFD